MKLRNIHGIVGEDLSNGLYKHVPSCPRELSAEPPINLFTDVNFNGMKP